MSDLATCLHYWSIPVGEEVGKSRSYCLRSRIQKLEEVYLRRQFGHALIAEHPVYLLSADHMWVLLLATLHGMQESFLTRD